MTEWKSPRIVLMNTFVDTKLAIYSYSYCKGVINARCILISEKRRIIVNSKELYGWGRDILHSKSSEFPFVKRAKEVINKLNSFKKNYLSVTFSNFLKGNNISFLRWEYGLVVFFSIYINLFVLRYLY